MNEVIIITAGFGLGLFILAVGLYLISRVGRFETRIHDRFDEMYRKVTDYVDEYAGEPATKQFAKLLGEPNVFRPQMAKVLERLDKIDRKLETVVSVPITGQIQHVADGHEPTLSLPEANSHKLREEFQAGVTRVVSYPEEMTLALTTRCNITPPCGICERNRRTPEEEYDVSPSVIANLVPVFRHLDTLYLHCSGEPTYSKYFDDVLALVDPPTKIRFNTHGITLDEALARRLIEGRRVDCINVSLDAARPETHHKLRGPGFTKIVENISAFQQLKKKLGSDRPLLLMNMCITREALEELPEFIELATRLGVDGVDLFHMNPGATFNWVAERQLPGESYRFDYVDQLKVDPVRHDELLAETYRKAKLLGIPLNFVGQGFLSRQLSPEQEAVAKYMNERERLPEKCMVPWSRCVVAEDGQVRMCYFHDERTEYIGDLSKEPFEVVWNSPKAIGVRQQMLDRVFAEPCLTSPTVCIFRGRV